MSDTTVLDSNLRNLVHNAIKYRTRRTRFGRLPTTRYHCAHRSA
jgi:hypothetical protein